MPSRILRLPEVIRRTGYSKSTIKRMEEAGKFCRRRQIGEQAVGWLESEVEEHITTRPRVPLPRVRADVPSASEEPLPEQRPHRGRGAREVDRDLRGGGAGP
jgi:prophage regulatory protein